MNVAGLPVVDVAPLVSGKGDRRAVAAEIGRACREYGFFYVVGHGLDPQLGERLERVSREFFAQDPERKRVVRMELGGRAWRGWFPVGGELTLGSADQKEGLYFGAELDAEQPRVKAGTPMHGPNLFPDVPGFRACVLEYMDRATELGHALMEGIALSLGLQASYFHDRYTADPLILLRIFNYPPLQPDPAAMTQLWSVGEHTDYGLLTILRQDDAGGLEVKVPTGWIDAPPLSGSLVCNIGDMLDRMTGGLYRSTPHRVRNSSDRARLSFPFFFDPDFEAQVSAIDTSAAVRDDRHERWDGASVHEISGTYGDYLVEKVSKVFPKLGRDHL